MVIAERMSSCSFSSSLSPQHSSSTVGEATVKFHTTKVKHLSFCLSPCPPSTKSSAISDCNSSINFSLPFDHSSSSSSSSFSNNLSATTGEEKEDSAASADSNNNITINGEFQISKLLETLNYSSSDDSLMQEFIDSPETEISIKIKDLIEPKSLESASHNQSEQSIQLPLSRCFIDDSTGTTMLLTSGNNSEEGNPSTGSSSGTRSNTASHSSESSTHDHRNPSNIRTSLRAKRKLCSSLSSSSNNLRNGKKNLIE